MVLTLHFRHSLAPPRFGSVTPFPPQQMLFSPLTFPAREFMFPLQPAAWLEHCGFFYFCHSMLIKLILAFQKFPPACASVCLRETRGEEVFLTQVSERKELCCKHPNCQVSQKCSRNTPGSQRVMIANSYNIAKENKVSTLKIAVCLE